jgi:hypothetical protein
MLFASASTLAFGWLVLVLINASGKLIWHNPMLWIPAISFCAATMLSIFSAVDDAEERVLSLTIAVVSGISLMGYAVFYFFVFGLAGK